MRTLCVDYGSEQLKACVGALLQHQTLAANADGGGGGMGEATKGIVQKARMAADLLQQQAAIESRVKERCVRTHALHAVTSRAPVTAAAGRAAVASPVRCCGVFSSASRLDGACVCIWRVQHAGIIVLQADEQAWAEPGVGCSLLAYQ